MANLMERRDKNGKLTSFTIRVFQGRDASGKQLKPATTSFPVEPGWSEKFARKKAQAFAVVFEKNIREGTVSDSRQTFSEYSEYCLTLCKTRGLKQTTLSSYRDLRERVVTFIGTIRLTDLKVADLNRITLALSSPGANKLNKKPLSPKSIIEHHHFISLCLEQAVKEGIIAVNLETRVTLPKREKKEAAFFTPEQIGIIREALESEPIRWKAFTHMLISTGARRGEILGLKWQDIDLETGQMHISRNWIYRSGKGCYLDTPKTRTSVRDIILPSSMITLLQEYQGWQIGERLRLGAFFENQDFVFTQDNGLPLHPDSVVNYFSKLSVKVGFPVHAHAFRHSVASALIFAGMDIVSVAKQLGHASPSITMGTYSHLLREADKRNADILEQLFLTDSKQKDVKTS